jgi:hypothetical protein
VRWLFTRLDPGSLAWILFVIRGTLVIFVSLGCLVHLLGPNLGLVFVISLLVLFEPFSLFCDRVRFGTERHWYGTLHRQLCCLVLSDRM